MDFAKSTAILTEHLGYAPIALIDDVINAVNDILYKCTTAMETFLSERYGEDEEIPADEIELGTAKLETLLESVVDRCFDKFELYVLRNLLIVPPELINGGWVRLEHQQGVDFTTTTNNQSLDDRLVKLRNELYQQKHLNFLLKTRSKRSAKLLTMLDGYRTSLRFLNQPHLVNQVAPLQETVQFLTRQVTQMMERIEAYSANTNLRKIELSKRDEYIDKFSQRALATLGTVDPSGGGFNVQVLQAEQAEKLANLV